MDADIIKQIKKDIMDGKMTLRSAASHYGIGKDTLKKMLEHEITDQTERERFRERMKINRCNSSTIRLDEKTEEIIISILKGEMTAKEASKKYHIDTETIRRKMNELVEKDSKYLKLYLKYCNKSAIDYGKINFKGLIIYMLRKDMSQSEIAEEYEIPARTISREVEKLGESEDEKDIKLYNIAKIYADKKMRKQRLTTYESQLYNKILDELFPDIPIIDLDAKSQNEIEIERLENFLRQVQMYQAQNISAEQIAKKMETSVSTIRRNRLKLEELKRKIECKRKDEESEEIGEI